jgi:hypothetical protein
VWIDAFEEDEGPTALKEMSEGGREDLTRQIAERKKQNGQKEGK